MSYTIIDADYVRRDADGALIPADPNNRDRSEYEAWIAAGNTPSQPPAPTLEEMKAARLAQLAERRWRAETGGTIVNGFPLSTDRDTQAKLTAAVVAAQIDSNYVVRWKLADGTFVLFDHASLIAVAQGVRAHVQACFDREAAFAAMIAEAADAEVLAAIDMDAGWPT